MKRQSRKQVQQTVAAWVFALLFFAVLCLVLFTDQVKTTDPTKRQIIMLFCALMGGMSAAFFGGKMTLNTDWSAGKKAGISATGGFAVFALIWIGLAKSNTAIGSSPADGSGKPHTRLVIGVNRYEMGGMGESMGSQKFEQEGQDISDETLTKASEWTAQQVRKACPQSEGQWTYHVNYQKNRISPLVLARRDLAGLQIPVRTFSTNRILLTNSPGAKVRTIPPLPRSLSITPSNDTVRIYYWLIGNNMKGHVLLENAAEYFEATTQPIILQLEQPGYELKLVQVNPLVSTNVPVDLKKVPVSLVLGSETAGAEGLVRRMIDTVGREKSFKVSDRSRLQERQQALDARYMLNQPEELNRKLSALRETRVDFVATVTVERFSK